MLRRWGRVRLTFRFQSLYGAIRSDEGLSLETSAFNLFTVANRTLSTQLINPKFYVFHLVTSLGFEASQ